MRPFESPDLKDRQSNAAKAKKAMLEKYRAAAEDPAAAERRAAKVKVNEARLTRQAEREAEKKVQQAKRAAQAARDAELAEQAKRDAAKAEQLAVVQKADEQAALEAEQKAARDARYAARKAAKKVRRRGF